MDFLNYLKQVYTDDDDDDDDDDDNNNNTRSPVILYLHYIWVPMIYQLRLLTFKNASFIIKLGEVYGRQLPPKLFLWAYSLSHWTEKKDKNIYTQLI